jgi:hypothetical protein
VDTSTVVRLRAKLTRSALVGKGDCQRAPRAVQANLVAALTTLVLIGGVRVGLVRRPRWGLPCQEAVASIFADLPTSTAKRVFSVEAGLATIEQFRTATEHEALGGRLRKNVTLRRAPQPTRPSKRGRPALHGPGLPPGAKRPEGRPDDDTTLRLEGRAVRVRRGRTLHFRETPQTAIEVVRVADPAYQRPLLIGTTARELTTAEVRLASGSRWPVATHFYGAPGPGAMGMPRAWSATAVTRRISVALLAGSLVKALAAAGAPLPMGPGDRKPARSAGRVANYVGLHTAHFVPLALQGVAPRTYRNFTPPQETTDSPLPLAA